MSSLSFLTDWVTGCCLETQCLLGDRDDDLPGEGEEVGLSVLLEIRLYVFLIVSDWLGDWMLSRNPADRDAGSLNTKREWSSPSWRRWRSGTLNTPLRSDSGSSLSSSDWRSDWLLSRDPADKDADSLHTMREWGSPSSAAGGEMCVASRVRLDCTRFPHYRPSVVAPGTLGPLLWLQRTHQP